MPQQESPTRSGADVLREIGVEALIEFLETSAYGVCVTGPDHTWVYANPAAERIFGVPFADMVGRDYLRHFPEHERAALVALEREQRQGDTSFYTSTVLRPDGTEVEMTWSGTVTEADGIELAPAIFHETTPVRRARRTAAEAVAAARAEGRDTKPELLAALVEEGVKGTRAVAGAVLLHDGGPLRWVAGHGTPAPTAAVVAGSGAVFDDLPGADDLGRGRAMYLSDARERYDARPPTRGWLAVTEGPAGRGAAQFPVWRVDRVAGAIVAVFPADVTSPSEAELAYWSSLAEEASVIVGAESVRRAASASSARSERSRIARDLHDSVSQALFTLQACAAAVRRGLAAGDPDSASEAAGTLEGLARRASAELRDLLTRMEEPPETSVDVVAAVEGTVERAALRGEVAIAVTAPPTSIPVRSAVAEHVGRIVGEALHNVHKHAAASAVQVSVTTEDGRLRVSVEDDGDGFDPASERAGGMGQRTMRERARLCGGELLVRSAPGNGTRVELCLPHPAEG